MATLRKVKHVMFTYRTEAGKGLDGRVRYKINHALQGEEVDVDVLSDLERERAERLGVFYDDDEETVVDTDFADMTVEELQDWIEEEKPTIQETLEATGGDPEVANRMLDAETAATGGDPRDGVVKGLTKIIEAGTQ